MVAELFVYVVGVFKMFFIYSGTDDVFCLIFEFFIINIIIIWEFYYYIDFVVNNMIILNIYIYSFHYYFFLIIL